MTDQPTIAGESLTMSSDSAREVAGRLSKAQRRVVSAMSGQWQRASDIPAAGSTLNSLEDFQRDFSTVESGIAPPVMIVHRDVCDRPLGYEWSLTALGVAVHRILRESTHD